MYYFTFYFCFFIISLLGGNEDGHNIPEIVVMRNLKDFLHDEKSLLNAARLNKSTMKEYHDGEKLLRFLEDGSLCLYKNKQYKGYHY